MLKMKTIQFIKKFLYRFMIVCLILLMAFAIVQRTTDNRGSILGIKVFTVITGSMIPVYNIGDILVVKEVEPENIKVDDDIVYEGQKGTVRNKTITHRVLEIDKKEDGNYGIITKGVANMFRDPEINQTQVLGKVMFKIPIISFILKIITNIYVLISIPVIILINKNIKRIIKMSEKS